MIFKEILLEQFKQIQIQNMLRMHLQSILVFIKTSKQGIINLTKKMEHKHSKNIKLKYI